jgi:hypothetical protein
MTIKEHPILFSTPMVQAILEGRKTMTRRIVSKSGLLEEYNKVTLDRDVEVCDPDEYGDYSDTKILKGLCAVFDEGEWNVKCKYDIGDILWVRETSASTISSGPSNKITRWYKADNPVIPERVKFKWKPSIFMPKGFCRIFLEITGIMVERLQDITEGDALKEGIDQSKCSGDWENPPSCVFTELWESINGKESWEENPWVWVIEFKRISMNIIYMKERQERETRRIYEMMEKDRKL